MEKWRFERCKQVLKDYPYIDKKIKEIEESIRVPYKETDVNAGIKGTRTETDGMLKTLWTIDSHKVLNELKKGKQAVKLLLEECDEDTATIINELNIRRFPRFTMQGLVEAKKIKCSRNTASKLRRRFFEELDKELNG